MTIEVAPTTRKAADYACKRWHYSGKIPTGKLITHGVWEDDTFIGTIIYGRGATPNLGKPYGLDQTQLCELVRVALDQHNAPVTSMMAASRRLLTTNNPGLRLIVSFADPEQGHHGGLYQAGSWIYAGDTGPQRYIKCNGRVWHPRSLGAKYGNKGQSIPWLRENVDPNVHYVDKPAKLRYLMPLDKRMRKQVAPLSKPYPKPERVTD